MNQKVSILLALLVTLVAIGSILHLSSKPDYRLLFANMELADAAQARERLDEEQILVQLRDHGRSIYVPAADVYRGRLLLAADGLPKDSSAGLELFEQPNFGLTEFAQQVNFQRAMQGELERTIRAIEGVQDARVMLVMPKDRLFMSKEAQSGSASIMVTLRRGAFLEPNQIESLSRLVSTAVPGLRGGDITVTDQQGRLLSNPHDQNDQLSGSPRRQMDVQRSIEQELTRKAQDMLDQAMGLGQGIVRVSAELDFRHVEKFNETYSAEGRVVVRETISSESSSDPVPLAGSGAARVAVGDPSNVTIEQPMGKTQREDIDTEYRVPSGRETVIDRGGRILRLSVSVSVARGAESRDPAALAQIERMVRSAVGFNPLREDTIEVLEMDFATPAIPPEQVTPWWLKIPVDLTAVLRIIAGASLLLILFLYSRKTMRRLSVQREDAGFPVSSYLEEDRPVAGALPDESHTPYGIDYASRLAEQNPAVVAGWIDHTVKGKS